MLGMSDFNKDLMKIETESLAFNTPYIILTIFWLITECNERNGVPLFYYIPFVFSKLFISPEKLMECSDETLSIWKTDIQKIRIFWNELTEVFFSISNSLYFSFL